jgi:tetratricopeptide (TPR) repeat protein
MPRLGTVPFAEYLLGELEKLRRYLNSLRLLARDVPLDIVILSHGEPLDELTRNCHDTDQVRYRLVDLQSVARRMGLDARTATPYADRLYTQLLLAKPPANHYATAADTRYYRLHQTRTGMIAASIALLLGAVGVSGFNFIEAVALKQEALGAQQKAAFYQARYDMARENLPRTAVEPNDIERAVGIIDALERHRPRPEQALALLSAALDRFPALVVERIDWRASADPNASIDGYEKPANTAAVEPAEPPEPVDEPELAYDYYHIALIGGHVADFDGNFRGALATVQEFAGTLRGGPDVYRAEVVSLPLDVSSQAKLEGTGTVGAAPAKARFAVRVTLGVRHGAS